jgi:hypothetical protein
MKEKAFDLQDHSDFAKQSRQTKLFATIART